MNKLQLVLTDTFSEAEQARKQLQEALHQTRSTMARQELLKRLWQLGADEVRKTEPDDRR